MYTVVLLEKKKKNLFPTKHRKKVNEFKYVFKTEIKLEVL